MKLAAHKASAIILAAGRGSRMQHLTDDQPKCHTVLHGTRLIDWQFKALKAAGTKEIAIVVGYREDKFDKIATRFRNPNWSTSNMVRSLLCASEWLSTRDCIVSYSDIVYSSNIVRNLLKANKSELAIAYDANWLALWSKRFDEPSSDAESFKLAGTRVTEIGKENPRLDEVQGQYMGLLKFTPNSWQQVETYLSTLSEQHINRLDMTSLLQNLIGLGLAIEGVENNTPWYEVDSEPDLVTYQNMPMVEIN